MSENRYPFGFWIGLIGVTGLLQQKANSCSKGMSQQLQIVLKMCSISGSSLCLTWCRPCWCRRSPWTAPGSAPPSARSPWGWAWPALQWTLCRSNSRPSGFSVAGCLREKFHMISWTHQFWLVRRSDLFCLQAWKVNWPGIDKDEKLG